MNFYKALFCIVIGWTNIVFAGNQNQNSEGLQIDEASGVTRISNILGGFFSRQTVMNVLLAVGLLIVGYFVARGVSSLLKKQMRKIIYGEREHVEKITLLIGNVVLVVCFLLFSFMSLGVLGIQFDFFLGGLSVGLGFALKEVVENFIAGLFVLTTKEFRIGDIVKLEGKYDFIGRIEEINLRYTVMRTFDMRRIVVPNIDLISNPMKTYSAEQIVRIELDLTIAHNVELQSVEQTVIDAVNTYEKIEKTESTRLILKGFNDAGQMLRLYVYVAASFESAAGYVQSDIYKIIKSTFDQEKISISYPHMALTVDEDDASLLKQAATVAKITQQMNRAG